MISVQLDPAHQRAIATLLQQDLQACNALEELLTQEGNALAQKDYSKQSQLIELKSQKLADLDSNSQKRQRFLISLKLPATQESWEGLLKQLDNPEIDKLWQQLQDKFNQCQRLNEINGKVISRSRQVMSRLLNIMRGQVATPDLYNQAGGRQSKRASHTLIQA